MKNIYATDYKLKTGHRLKIKNMSHRLKIKINVPLIKIENIHRLKIKKYASNKIGYHKAV